MLHHPREQRLQILQIEQQQALLVGDAERRIQHAALRVVQFEQVREQQRTDFRHRRAHRMTGLSVDVPERDRITALLITLARNQSETSIGFLVRLTGRGDAGEVALHVGREHRHAHAREAFGEHLQRDCFAGAGSTGDEPVSIAHRAELQHRLFVFGADDDVRSSHAWLQR